jgi:prephenate dehydrogenase
MSVVVRLPEDLYESARRIAALQGRQAGDLLSEAWQQYLESHREQLASDFEEAAQLLRSGDTTRLTEFAARTAKVRAEEAARAART